MRLSLGLTSLTVGLLFAANAVGLVPDSEAAELKGRKALCESLAIACSLAAQRDDGPMIQYVIRSVVDRNPEMLSAAARRAGAASSWRCPRARTCATRGAPRRRTRSDATAAWP